MRRIKVAAHVHSEWSYDASWTLPRLAAAFGRRGFDALLMSEHDDGFDPQRWHQYEGACAAASTPATLLVPGIEYADSDNAVHIPVWGDVPFLGSDIGTGALLTRARSEGGFAVFAHPWRRRAWERFDESWLQYLSAVEIWNRKYDGWSARPEAVQLARRHGLDPFVALDFHTRRQFFPLALGVDIEGAVTRDSVQQALHAGRFEPLFMSRSALRFTDGRLARGLAALELGRRQAAGLLRNARNRAGRNR
jgi:hypothetical protein